MITDKIARLEEGEVQSITVPEIIEPVKQFGDWRDDVLAMGISLHLVHSTCAEPVCPQHGWLWIRKKVSYWKCTHVDDEVEKEIKRKWHEDHPRHLETFEDACEDAFEMMQSNSPRARDYRRAIRHAGECGFSVKVDEGYYREWVKKTRESERRRYD